MSRPWPEFPCHVRTSETRGARTGLARSNAVIYFHDGELVTIIASQAGRPSNPAWYYNAVANPDVILGGQRFTAAAVEAAADRRLVISRTTHAARYVTDLPSPSPLSCSPHPHPTSSTTCTTA